MPAPLPRTARTGRTMSGLAAAFFFLPLVLAPETAFAKCREGECWGAVAFSRLNGYWVYSMNHPGRVAARSRAWLMCEKRCTNVVTVKNGCLALFVTPKGRYAMAEGPTAKEATEAARQQCRAKYGKCRFRVTRCTADFEVLKQRALEEQRKKSEGRGLVVPKTPPSARVEELKL